MLNLSQATIRSYLHAFNDASFAGLQPGKPSGRRAKLNWTKAQWEDLLAQAPAHFERLETGAQNWTQKLLRHYLAEYQGCTISQGTLSKQLKAAGISWNRARQRVHSPDPHYVIKRQRVEELRQMALRGELSAAQATHPPPATTQKRTYLVYFDAADLHWCPEVGATYMPTGQQLKVDTPGQENPWYSVLGSLIYPSGDGHYTIHERKRAKEVVNHLQSLLARDPDGFWFVILDNASAHQSVLVNSFVKEQRQSMELVFLPTYSPHLNLIERLWRMMRRQVTKDKFYDSLDTLAQAVKVWLEKLPSAQFCSLIGVNENDLQFL